MATFGKPVELCSDVTQERVAHRSEERIEIEVS